MITTGLRPSILLAGVALLALFGAKAHAQLNELRIERDATGIYKGSIQGGTIFFYYDGYPADGPYTPGGGAGKMRVPVKSGASSSTLSDSELPGNDKAPCSGRWQRTDVKRGGKLIALKGTGSANPDDSEGGKWTNGACAGSLTDKGPKWNAAGKFGSRRVIAGHTDNTDPMNPVVHPGYTETVTGMHVTAKD